MPDDNNSIFFPSSFSHSVVFIQLIPIIELALQNAQCTMEYDKLCTFDLGSDGLSTFSHGFLVYLLVSIFFFREKGSQQMHIARNIVFY